MDLTVATYLAYLAITIPLTVWVGWALHRHGALFLVDVFQGDGDLARAVNQLLVIGFYLLNLGWVAYSLSATHTVVDAEEMIRQLSQRVGIVSIVLGLIHFANVWAFNSFRRRAVLRAEAIPPVAPNGRTLVVPAPPVGAQ